ncbi:MAG: hypothetical protein HY862_12660 [Chloroflexi bacterium]|nr:hypothetical protein [Chloroflexota bacterium]
MKLFCRIVVGVVMLLVFVPHVSAQGDLNLPLNTPTTGTLSPSAPQQTWRFEITQPQTVSLDVTRITGNSVLIAILNQMNNADTPLQLVKARGDADGRVLVPQLYLEVGSYALTITGDLVTAGGDTVNYQVVVATFGASTPVITAFTPSPTINLPPTATPSTNLTQTPVNEVGISGFKLVETGEQLEFGEMREGAFEQEGDIHQFSFFGTAEMVVTLSFSRMDEDATFDPYLRVQAPDGTIIAENDDVVETTLDAVINSLILPVDGTYTIFAGSASGFGVGNYLIGVGLGVTVADVERGTLAPDFTQTSTLEFYGARDRWAIGLQAGDVVTIALNRVDITTFDPMVELEGPRGVSLAFDDDSGGDKNALINGLTVVESGLYIINVAGYGNSDLGTYELRWSRQSANITISSPTPTTTTLSLPSPTKSVSQLPSPQASPTSLTTASAPTATIFATATATAATAAAAAAVLPPTGSEHGTVEEGGVFERQIDIAAGDSLLVFVEGYWSFDAILEVVDPSGVVLETVDDVGFNTTFDRNPRLTMIVPVEGRYLLRVYGYEGSAGEFSLNWRVQ